MYCSFINSEKNKGHKNVHNKQNSLLQIHCVDHNGYCQPNTIINITQHDIMCKGNHMGWLCGHCKVNCHVVLGSNDCYECSNTLHLEDVFG